MRYLLPLFLCAGCIPRLYTSGPPTPTGGDWVAPENGWGVTEPPADLVGEGYEAGQVVPDFRLTDQHGDEVSLWQFYDSVILLDVATIWCLPCQELGAHTEATWLEFKDQGFTYLTVLQEDFDGAPPDADDLQLWIDLFGITAPVLADPDKLGPSGALIRPGEYPAVLLIGRDMRVIDRLVADEAQITAAIEDAL